MTTTNAATPMKLSDGSWGAKVQGVANVGDTITVRTRAGKTWTATVSSIVTSDSKSTVCATQRGSSSRPVARPSYRRGPDAGPTESIAGYSNYCTDNDYCGCYDCAS